MIALLRSCRWLDHVVVIDQIWVVLMRIAAEKSVVALHAAAKRPAIVRSRGADLLGRRQMPFPDRIRVVAVHQQNFRQEPILKRNNAVRARIARGSLRNAGHAIGMMIASGKYAGPSR